jgi:hypothetical protein
VNRVDRHNGCGKFRICKFSDFHDIDLELNSPKALRMPISQSDAILSSKSESNS